MAKHCYHQLNMTSTTSQGRSKIARVVSSKVGKLSDTPRTCQSRICLTKRNLYKYHSVSLLLYTLMCFRFTKKRLHCLTGYNAVIIPSSPEEQRYHSTRQQRSSPSWMPLPLTGNSHCPLKSVTSPTMVINSLL